MPRKARTLTARQERFVQEYLVDLNPQAAYVRAGFSPNNTERNAYTLLSTPHVAAAIAEAKAARAKRVEVQQDDVLRALIRHYSFDPALAFDAENRPLPIHQMPDDVRLVMSRFKVEERGCGGRELDDGGTAPGVVRVTEVNFPDRMDAVKAAMKHLGIAGNEKVELTGNLSDLVLAAQRAREAKAKAKK